LIRCHPVLDLDESELENAQIHYIARVLANLYAITHLKGSPPKDESPPGQVGHGISQRDGQACGQQPQKGGDGLRTLQPHGAYKEQCQYHRQVG